VVGGIMKILSEKQLPSGDYELTCDFSDQEIQMLVQYAFVNILKDMVKREKRKEKRNEPLQTKHDKKRF
jgi:hypothetical protein